MLTIPGSVRIFIGRNPVDMRKSIDGLMSIVQEELRQDAYSGHLFVLTSRRADRVKILTWDRGGFILYYKRLEQGRFRMPAVPKDALGIQLDATQLTMLLDGIDYSHVRRPKQWAPQTRQGTESLIYPSRWHRSPKTTTVRGAKKP